MSRAQPYLGVTILDKINEKLRTPFPHFNDVKMVSFSCCASSSLIGGEGWFYFQFYLKQIPSHNLSVSWTTTLLQGKQPFRLKKSPMFTFWRGYLHKVADIFVSFSTSVHKTYRQPCFYLVTELHGSPRKSWFSDPLASRGLIT